jgi:hypothetical protein
VKEPSYSKPAVSQENKPDNLMSVNTLGIALLADHLENYLTRIRGYGEHIADQYGNVALLNIDSYEAGLIEIMDRSIASGNQESASAKQADDIWQAILADEPKRIDSETIAETEDFENGLWPALKEFAQDYAEVVFHIDKSYQKHCRQLIEHCCRLVILTSCEHNDIIETYKVIKWLASDKQESKEAFLFVCDATNENAALEVHKKLAQTANDFLGMTLIYAGCSTVANKFKEMSFEPESGSPINSAEIKNKENEESEQVKDIPSVPQSIDPPVSPVKQRPLPQCPIPVVSFPNNDVELAEALQLALPGWLTDVPAAMVVPVSKPSDLEPAARVLIDATGRLLVLLPSLTGNDNLLNQALHVRKWLSDNLNLIVNSCPQIKIDRSLPTGLILITPPPINSLQMSYSQIRQFPILFKQLHLLQNGSNKSILIM